MAMNVYRLLNDAKNVRDARGEDGAKFIHKGDDRVSQADRWVAWHSSAAPEVAFGSLMESAHGAHVGEAEIKSDQPYILPGEEMPAVRSFSNYNQIMERHNHALRSVHGQRR